MKRMLGFCILIAALALLGTPAVPMQAQDDNPCDFDFTTIEALFRQAEAAYAAGDVVTALGYIDQAQAALATLEANCLASGGPQLLSLALLSSEDLVSGWVAQSGPTPLTAPPTNLFCTTLEGSFETQGVQAAFVSSTAPVGLVEAIYYFPNGDAADYFALARTATESCYEQQWQQLYRGETTIEASLVPLPVTVLGDESFGAKLTNTGLPDVDILQTDTLYIRLGDTIIALAYYRTGEGDLDDVQALLLAQLGLQKLMRFQGAAMTSVSVDNAELFLVALGAGDRDAAEALVCESARDSLDDLFALFESQAAGGTLSITEIRCQVSDSQRITCSFVVEVTSDTQTLRTPRSITFLLDDAGNICGSE